MKEKNSKEIAIIDNSNMPKTDKVLHILFAFRPLLRLNFFKNIVKKKLKHCENVSISPNIYFRFGNIYAKDVQLSDTDFFDYSPIYIGEGTKFFHKNTVLTSQHDLKDWDKIITRPIHIGKNVMITTNCTILGGVTIGDNSVIGAGSVVTRDIPPNCLACGVPAKVVRYFKKGER